MGSISSLPALHRGARADHSRFVQRIRRRYGGELPLLAEGLPTRDAIDTLIEQLLTNGRPLASAMRVARQLVLERLAVLDVEQGALMPDITRAMTELAEATLDRALAQARADHDARFGVPRNASGVRCGGVDIGSGATSGLKRPRPATP